MWVSGPLPRGRSHIRWSSSTSNEKRLTVRWRTRRTLPRQAKFRTLLRPWQRRRRRFGSSRRLPRQPRPGLLARRPMAAGSGAKGSGKGAASKICFHFRDHGNCPKGDSCPFSHDKELRKQALAAKRGESTLAAKGGKGGGKGGGKAGFGQGQAQGQAEGCTEVSTEASWHGLSVLPEDGLVQEGCQLRHGAQLAGRAGSSLAGQLGPSFGSVHEQSVCCVQHPDR